MFTGLLLSICLLQTFHSSKGADLVLGTVLLSYENYKRIDYPIPWTSSGLLNLIIPYPAIEKNALDLGAIVRPWSWKVIIQRDAKSTNVLE